MRGFTHVVSGDTISDSALKKQVDKLVDEAFQNYKMSGDMNQAVQSAVKKQANP